MACPNCRVKGQEAERLAILERFDVMRAVVADPSATAGGQLAAEPAGKYESPGRRHNIHRHGHPLGTGKTNCREEN